MDAHTIAKACHRFHYGQAVYRMGDESDENACTSKSHRGCDDGAMRRSTHNGAPGVLEKNLRRSCSFAPFSNSKLRPSAHRSKVKHRKEQFN